MFRTDGKTLLETMDNTETKPQTVTPVNNVSTDQVISTVIDGASGLTNVNIPIKLSCPTPIVSSQPTHSNIHGTETDTDALKRLHDLFDGIDVSDNSGKTKALEICRQEREACMKAGRYAEENLATAQQKITELSAENEILNL